MNISAKVDYACRALLDLSLRWPDQSPLQVGKIAKRQQIPIKFLIHILIQLKQLGCVESVRGKMGGYVLTKSPNEIKFSDIINAFGGLGISMTQKSKRGTSVHVMDMVWKEADEAIVKSLEQITFETIANRARSKDKTVMYEI